MWKWLKGRSASSEDSHDPWPRFVVFAIALRDPLPLPQHTTFTRVLDEDLPALAGLAVHVSDDSELPPLPTEGMGQRIVSLKVWQLKRTPTHEERELLDGAMRVLKYAGDLESDSAGLDSTEGEYQDQDEDGEDYRTVIEAVTIIQSPEEMSANKTRSDALTLCLGTLFEVVRAYRLVNQVPISELTYERVLPFVPFRFRRLDSPKYLGGSSVMMLDHTNVSTPAPELLSLESMEIQRQLLERLLKGDPFLVYSERRLEARIACHRDGQYAESAIQAAIAAEVLLDGLLSMLLWEEQIGFHQVDVAADTLGADLAKRVRSQFHPRLGGQWTLKGDGPLGRWYALTAGLRNRVVHRGYRPTKEEAERSLLALQDLERFVCDRLAERTRQYPRTALALLGAEGLRRRGKWDASKFGDLVIGPMVESIAQHAEWRDSVDAALTIRRLS